MLNDGTGFKKINLAMGFTDLRRGIDGLANIVRFHFHLDPYDKNTLFLFVADVATGSKICSGKGMDFYFCINDWITEHFIGQGLQMKHWRFQKNSIVC